MPGSMQDQYEIKSEDVTIAAQRRIDRKISF